MHNFSDLASPPPLSELAAQHSIALFLDFDGTLVEIAETPDAIAVPNNLARRLEALNARFDARLALISGRSLSDIAAHLGHINVMTVGSHGAEFGKAAASSGALLDATATAVAALAAQWPALLVETKPHGLAIHYRQEPDAEQAVLSLMDDIAEREGLSLKRGKMVVEIGPAGMNKGQAVAQLMALPPYQGATPIFIGDDVTDEDGFTAAAAAGGHGILVGANRATDAHYRLSTTQQVHQWLNL